MPKHVEIDRFNEPWKISNGAEPGTDELAGILITRRNEIIVDPIGVTVPLDHQAAYLRRITACVNACAGLTTDDLERMKAGELACMFLDDRANKLAGVTR